MKDSLDAVFIYFNKVQGFISGAEYQLDSAYIRCFLKKSGMNTLQYINKNINRYKKVVDDLNELNAQNYIFYINEYNYNFSRLVINHLKAITPAIKTFIIGPSAKYIGRKLRHEISVDVYVLSFGAHELQEIIGLNKPLSSVANIGYFDNNTYIETEKMDRNYSLDDLGLPYTEKMIPAEEVQNVGMLTSNGCYGRCSFCSYINTSKFRVHSIENVVSELEYINQFIGGKNTAVNFLDDCFSVSNKRTLDLCHRIIEKSIDFTFWCCTRADLLSEELIDAMAASNFKNIVIGLETASENVMDKLGKVPPKETAETYIEKVRYMYEYAGNRGISPVLSVNFGLPFEKLDDAYKTIDFLRVNGVKNVSVCFMSSFPGSPIFENSDIYGTVKKAGPCSLPYRTYYTGYDMRKVYHRLMDTGVLTDSVNELVLGRQRILSDLYSFYTGVFQERDLYDSIKVIHCDQYGEKEAKFIDNNVDLNGSIIMDQEKIKLSSSYLFCDDRKRLKIELEDYDINQERAHKENWFLANQAFVKPVEDGVLVQYENCYYRKPLKIKFKKIKSLRDLMSLGEVAESFFLKGTAKVQDLKDSIMENSCAFCGECSICSVPRVSIVSGKLFSCLNYGEVGNVQHSYKDILKNIVSQIEERDRKRACNSCVASRWCSRCLFPPEYIGESDYCEFIKNHPTLVVYLKLVNYLKPLLLKDADISNLVLRIFKFNKESSAIKSIKDVNMAAESLYLITLSNIMFIANLGEGHIRSVSDKERPVVEALFGLGKTGIDQYSMVSIVTERLIREGFLN
ncbi:B12-binding domain-containing radical SAM protein [Clostridium thermarum]|uniref:B12-binding domain-containing radical SAM protein n=1 Tax=Clostridium thermarum TaxID=1716543 RepID=UPI0013D82536|nr:radical SAM protein [Clostridium thermarum]